MQCVRCYRTFVYAAAFQHVSPSHCPDIPILTLPSTSRRTFVLVCRPLVEDTSGHVSIVAPRLLQLAVSNMLVAGASDPPVIEYRNG